LKTCALHSSLILAGYSKEFGYDFSNLRVTGVSLGGGLAIITGAQTDAYTVAISGLGATLSREALDPPIELEKLNAQVRLTRCASFYESMAIFNATI